MRSFWIIQVGPKPNDKYPYKRRRRHRQNWGGHREGAVKTEAEIGDMQPQTEERLKPPETGRGKDRILP